MDSSKYYINKDIVSKIESYVKIFWIISIVCSVLIFIGSIMQASALADAGMGEFGSLVVIIYLVVLLAVLAMLYFSILLIKGFAALIDNTNEIQNILAEMKDNK